MPPRAAGGSAAVNCEAAVLRQHQSPMRLETLTLEPPRPDEVRIRLVAAGVCHTDISVYAGHLTLPTPIILGHEGAGIVEEIGSQVGIVNIGDAVVMTYSSCGRCEYCSTGQPAFCTHWFALNFAGERSDGSVAACGEAGPVHTHFFGQSAFATHAIVNERNLIKVPSTLPLARLAPLGCGIQTGAGAVFDSLQVAPGQSFACVGAGSVGLSAIMAARVCGAGAIIAIDRHPERLKLALELGATHTVHTPSDDLAEAILSITDRTGADHILDTTGIAELVAQAQVALARRGSLGVAAVGAKATYTIDARRLMSMGQRLIGIVEGNTVPHVLLPRLIELHQQGRFPFDRLLRFYDFSEIDQAIADSRSGAVVKPVLLFPAGG